MNKMITDNKKEWEEVELGGVIEILGGGTPKTTVPEYWNGDIPWLSVVDFNNDRRWVNDTEKSITREGLKNSATQLLQEGDIIISARGTVGALAQVKRSMAFNQSCYGIRAIEGRTDNDFLYYLIKNSVGQIVKNVHGAVFDTITRQTFNNIVVSLPPLPTQRSIAAVLSSFDDKIELLRKENETLEKIAQTVFNEWFVKFNFPNEEGRPYRDSGGKMVELELGEVPEGWKVDEIGSYVKVVGGSTPSTKVKEFWNGDIYWTTPKDLSANKENTYIFSSEKKITEQGLVEIGSRLLPENTLLLSSRAPIGYLAITGMKTAINQGHIAFMPGAYFSSEYMYLWLRGNMDKVEAVAHGAVFPEISKSSFKRVQAVIPTQDVLSSWQLGVGVLFQKIKNNSNQIKTLSKLRDTLLPKLMSGEVGVA